MVDHSVSRFWDKFINKTMSYGVKDNSTRWYVKHDGIKLTHHNPEHVEAYLKEKGRNIRLEDWQFIQVVRAIQILFTEMVQANWAKSLPWEE